MHLFRVEFQEWAFDGGEAAGDAAAEAATVAAVAASIRTEKNVVNSQWRNCQLLDDVISDAGAVFLQEPKKKESSFIIFFLYNSRNYRIIIS